MSERLRDAWEHLANHFEAKAAERSGSPQQIAYLTLAQHCAYIASDDRGGPTREVIALAEQITGVNLTTMLADFFNRTS